MTGREPKWWFVAYSAGLGGVLAVASLLGGEPPVVAVSFVVLLAVSGAVMAQTPFGTLRERSQDEREQSIAKDAALISHLVVVGVVIVGFVVELARGADGRPWTLIGGAGGLSYAAALAVLSRRR